MSADRRVNSCNVASGVSMDCVATNTSRFACARGGGQVAAKTGETKTGKPRIAVAATIRPIGLGIVPLPPHSKSASMQRQIPPLRKLRISADRPGQSSRVLRNAATERPVFLRDLHQVDHHVLRPRIQLRMHIVDDALVKRLLLLGDRPAFSVIWIRTTSLL